MSTPRSENETQPTERDKMLFAELDSSSKTLRDSASAFAKSLEQTEKKSKELEQLIQALKKVETCEISELLAALEEFRTALLTISLHSSPENIFGDSVKPEELPPILEKYTVFIQDLMALIEKSEEIDK